MSFELGSVIDDRYRLLTEIGAGAHGVVYRARDLESRAEVAIKVLNREVASNANYVERLQREATAMARLRGTSAVYVHGFRRGPRHTYLTMELLNGVDLQQYLEAAEKVGGRIKRGRLAEVMRPVIDTLEVAHSQGIVHRDLKPSNIFVVSREHGGGVRLLDFGLVKLLDAQGFTAQGLVAGTPSYIAPEAWRGNPLELDHRIDVYALGVIVFRSLAGRVPYQSKNLVDVLRWAQTGARPRLTEFRSELPARIDDWVQRALAVRPDQRYQSVRELWNQIEPLLVKHATNPF